MKIDIEGVLIITLLLLALGLALVPFVAAFLAVFGHSLNEGDLLLSGAFIASAPRLTPGGVATAEYGPMGSVTARVAV